MSDTLAAALPAPVAPAASFGHRLAPAGDPLEGASFDTLYDQAIKPELQRCEAERQSALNLFIGALAAGLVLGTVAYLFVHDVRVAIIAVIGLAVVGYMPLQRVARLAKASVVSALCAPLGITYQLSCSGPDYEDFLLYKLQPAPSEKTFEDFFAGKRGDVDFALYEATLHQGSGKSRHLVFQGQLFRLTTPRKLLGTTVVLRDSGRLNRFECPAGLEKVGLEDPHFEQTFEVFGSDQVEAREILTPTFMEELVNLETGYAGKHLRCAFVGSDLFVALEGGNRFEIGNMFTTLVDRSRVEGIARDIEQVFKLIDAFCGQ